MIWQKKALGWVKAPGESPLDLGSHLEVQVSGYGYRTLPQKPLI